MSWRRAGLRNVERRARELRTLADGIRRDEVLRRLERWMAKKATERVRVGVTKVARSLAWAELQSRLDSYIKRAFGARPGSALWAAICRRSRPYLEACNIHLPRPMPDTTGDLLALLVDIRAAQMEASAQYIREELKAEEAMEATG